MTVDLIVNRNTRQLDSNTGLRRTLLAEAKRGSARVHETHTLDDLERVAREIAAGGTDCVILAGGDGSHMAGVSALARAFGGPFPPVALAPCGTVCTVARNFGMRGSRRGCAERVIRAACGGVARIETRSTLRVSDDAGGKRVGFIFGAGLVARFFEVYYRSPRPGIATAARIAARVFAGSFLGLPLARKVLEPVRCEISIDGQARAEDAWSLVVASVVRDVGLHLLATYRAGEAPDRFHVVASGLPPKALGHQLPNVLRGRPLRGDPHVDLLARALHLSHGIPGGTYVLDGDVFRAQEIHVESGPAIRLLVPPTDLR